MSTQPAPTPRRTYQGPQPVRGPATAASSKPTTALPPPAPRAPLPPAEPVVAPARFEASAALWLAPTDTRPALCTQAEVEAIRAASDTDAARYTALARLCQPREAYWDLDHGMPPLDELTEDKRQNAAEFFQLNGVALAPKANAAALTPTPPVATTPTAKPSTGPLPDAIGGAVRGGGFSFVIRHQTKPVYKEFPQRSLLLYGDPKVGKTTCGAQFPNALILSVAGERGTDEIAGAVVDVANANALREIVRELAERGGGGFTTVVLDGISTLAMGQSAGAKDARGKDVRDPRRATQIANRDLLPALHEFLALPLIRVITGHARRDEEEIKIDGGETLKKISVYPDLPPRLRLFIEGRLDGFGYCYVKGGNSQVWWTPLDTDTRKIAAGNRLGLPQTTALTYEALHNALVK